MSQSVYQPLDHGITTIDTGLGRPHLAACYLMEQGDRAAIIETGTQHTVPRILALLADKGYQREQVDYVIVTHVHLDHAGGVGGLMQALPNAQLVVHERGARHMIDPSKLQAGATAVYGEAAYQAQYGDLIAVDEKRIYSPADGETLDFNNRPLQFFDTPGHARHHFCVYDKISQGIFTGDTMGLCYRELSAGYPPFVMPTTTPVQFDPEAMKASVDRMLALKPERLYLTHYSELNELENHRQQLHEQIDAYVTMAEKYRNSDNRGAQLTEALMDYALERLAHNGSPLSPDEQKQMLAMDIMLNAQGLDVWLGQSEK